LLSWVTPSLPLVHERIVMTERRCLRAAALATLALLTTALASVACDPVATEDEPVDSIGSALAGEVSLFTASDAPQTAAVADSVAVELGVRFRASRAGKVNGIRFYKGAGNTGTHVGHLWSTTGAKLGEVTFTGETASGWQTARFASPIAIEPGVTYVASYHAPVGRYAATGGAFASASLSRPPLVALQDKQDGRNGVYRYGASSFPTDSYAATNYFVDVVFRPDDGEATGSCSNAAIAGVSASANDGNAPANVLDGNLATRWSNLGKGSWIRGDLGATKSLCSVSVAWYAGDQRKATFKVQVSADGTTFTDVVGGQSSGSSNALETYTFAPRSGRYIRVVVDGNTTNDWASITELRAGASGSSTPTPTPTTPPTTPAPTTPPPTTPPPATSGWPSAATTGVPAGVTLSAYSGPMSISAAGTVIDGKTISGMLRVTGANVVIKNSRLSFGGTWGIDAEGAQNVTVQDCDLVGAGLAGTSNAAILGSGNFLRNDISKAENGIVLTGGASTVKGNYIHDLEAAGADPHYDGLSVQGGQNGVLIEDNTILARDTSDIIIKNDFGPITNVRVNHNFLGGSPGYNVYVYGPNATNVSVTNNTLAKGGYGYYATSQASPTISGNIELPSGSKPW